MKIKDTIPVKAFEKVLVFFIVVFSVLYFYKLGSFGLIDVDEPRYAEAAREMLESGNYIVPYFNYVVRYDKPVFFYWLEAFSMKLFGVNEFAARLPSVAMALLAISLVFIVLDNVFNRITAFLGTVVLMSSTIFVGLSRFSIPDMTLAAFISGSMISFFLGYKEIVDSGRYFKNQIKTFSNWYLIAFILMAFGVLTKGPVAVVIPFCVLFPFFWWIRKLEYALRNYSFWCGLVFFFILVLPWYLRVHYATGGDFTNVFFGVHNFSRYTSVVSGHKGHILFYVPVVLVGFFPWTMFLFQALTSAFNRVHELDRSIKNQLVFLCAWWAVFVFVFFTFSRTQLLTYILSLFPALSIVVAAWFHRILKNKEDKLWLVVGLGVSFVTCLALYYLTLTNMDSILVKELRGLSIKVDVLVLISILFVGVSMAWASSYKDFPMMFSLLAFSSLSMYFFFGSVLLPKVDAYSQKTSRGFLSSLPKEVKVVSYQSEKPTYVFYSKRPVSFVNKYRIVQSEVDSEGKVALIARKKKLHKLDVSMLTKVLEDSRNAYFVNY